MVILYKKPERRRIRDREEWERQDSSVPLKKEDYKRKFGNFGARYGRFSVNGKPSTHFFHGDEEMT